MDKIQFIQTYLADIFLKMNEVNLPFQGNNSLSLTSVVKFQVFKQKLKFLQTYLTL